MSGLRKLVPTRSSSNASSRSSAHVRLPSTDDSTEVLPVMPDVSPESDHGLASLTPGSSLADTPVDQARPGSRASTTRANAGTVRTLGSV